MSDALKKQIALAREKIAARAKAAGRPAPTMERKPLPEIGPAKRAKPPAAQAPLLADEMASDAAAGESNVASSKLMMERIQGLVVEAREAALEVARQELALTKAKASLSLILQVDLPELLREAGVAEIKLEDGTIVTAKDEFNCGISEARAPEAHGWLRDHGYGALIKNVVSVSFGKGEEKKAEAAITLLVKKFGNEAVAQKESVHYQTLKAFIKERIAAVGQDKAQAVNVPPSDLFGIVPYTIAAIKLPKGGAQ